MGLLSRVIDSRSNGHSGQTESFFFDAHSIETGFEYSKNIFTLLCEYLSIEKGALLILDEKTSTFVPGNLLNLDITTSRHFRIESSFFNNQVNNFNRIILKENPLFKEFKHYFSIREFSALASIMFVPFYLNGTLTSVLIIIDPEERSVKTAREISFGSAKIVKKLLKSRSPFSNGSSTFTEPANKDPYSLLETFINSSNIDEPKSLLIIKLNIKKLTEELQKSLPEADIFNIYNDVIQSISKLVSNSGELIKISEISYLVYYSLRKESTPGLIIHQINVAVSAFFSLDKKLPDISESNVVFKGPITVSVQSLLEGFI